MGHRYRPVTDQLDSSVMANTETEKLAGAANVEVSFPSIPFKKILVSLIIATVVVFIVYWFFVSINSKENEFPPGVFVTSIQPQTWAALGIAIAFSFSVIGAGW